ncbi:MAG: SpoIIE family protein phosphatase [Victivallales bacterium]|nr:SpoIIE family protein phosphatase [Victivallales bacterium]
MTLPFTIIILLILLLGVLAIFSFVLSSRNFVLVNKIKDVMHQKAEISNFLSLFSHNLHALQDIDNSMNMTARYVADLIECQSLCIYELRSGYLHTSGICGNFPLLHQSSQYILTKPKYIHEALRRDRIKLGEGLIGQTAAKRENIFIEDAASDPRLSGASTLIPIRTLMAIPMIREGKVTGVICAVNNRSKDKPFTPEQFSRLKFISSQVLLSQTFVQVYSSLSEQQRINQELEFARRLQASLLPESFPPWDRFIVHSFTRSAKEVSGDFYDFMEIDDNRLLIVIGDACGKGIPACMIMAMARSFIRSAVTRFTTMENLLKELNHNLYRDTAPDSFMTLACCLLDKKDSIMEYGRAGHTELISFVRNHIRKIYPKGSALGLMPNELARFETITLTFDPEMSILLFTDGITEALNMKDEEFGIDRLCHAFEGSGINGDTPVITIEKILHAIDNFTGTTDASMQNDDQTMVIIHHL